MRGRSLTRIAAAAVIALVATACGSSGSSGLASRTPNEIVAQATHAIDHVHSVRVAGSVGDGSPSNTVKLDLDLVAGKGATGSVSERGTSFKLVVVGGQVYLNGSAAFWTDFGGAAVAQRLSGRWVRGSETSGAFGSFKEFTDIHGLLARLLSGHGGLTKGATSTINGHRVIAVDDQTKHGTLYVATTGTPYPIRLSNGSSDGGQIDFSRFDHPVSLKAPSRSIAIASLQH